MWNIVRIFISSTFKDMDVERDALKNIVLPQLNHYFAPMRYQIEMVDLRHSIETDKEESAEQREKIIFNICMDEIESCKPFFLGLVGHRYGWIPDKQQMLPPSIYDTLPDDFPIGRQHLSVTVFEFLNGIFNPQANFDRTNTLVLLRDDASYEGIGETRLRDYVDTGDNRRYVGLLRDYLAAHRHDYRLTRYTLKLQQATSEHVLRWSEAVCQQLQRQLSAYINARQEATTETLRQEEAYVNGMTRHFAGREADISALMDILHTRHVAHVNQHEDGLGQSALLCRLYELLRHDPERLCLFHAVEAYPDGNEFSIVLYDWCWLMCRELGEGWEALEERKGNLSQLDKLFQQLMERIRVERHKTVTICLDDPQRARGSLRLRYAFVDVVLTERMPAEYDRDMGNYVLKPLTPADRALVARDDKEITKHVRHPKERALGVTTPRSAPGLQHQKTDHCRADGYLRLQPETLREAHQGRDRLCRGRWRAGGAGQKDPRTGGRLQSLVHPAGTGQGAHLLPGHQRPHESGEHDLAGILARVRGKTSTVGQSDGVLQYAPGRAAIHSRGPSGR